MTIRVQQFGLFSLCVMSVCLMLGCASGEYASQQDYESEIAANADIAELPSPKEISDDMATRASRIAGRKIVFTASVSLVVENYSKLESDLTAVILANDAFVADSTQTGEVGSRSGSWSVRVPVERFEPFLTSASALGEVVSKKRNSKDVTEEFVDLQSRIENKKRLEARIAEILERKSDSLSDIIKVEHELGRVRESIERMEGRMRYLKDKTAFTTVTIRAHEQEFIQPPTEPTFSERVAATWAASVDQAKSCYESVVIFIVGNFIGFIALLVVGIVVWILTLIVSKWFNRVRTVQL